MAQRISEKLEGCRTQLLQNISQHIAVGDPNDHQNGRLDDRSGLYLRRICAYAGLDSKNEKSRDVIAKLGPLVEGIIFYSNGIQYHLKWHANSWKIEVIFITPSP